MFDQIKLSRNNTRFLRMIQLLGDKDGTEERINTTDLEMDITNPYYPENVLNLNLSRFEGLQKKRIISVGFENLQIQNVEKLELRFFDRGLLTRRPLVSLGQYNGDLITIPPSCDPNVSFENHYDIILDQNKFLEEDKSKNCVNYPNEKFQDYQSCDVSFQKEILEKHSPYKPFWAFGRLANEEPNHLYIPSAHLPVNLLYTGAKKSPCPLPCTTTVARTKFRFEKTSEKRPHIWVVNNGHLDFYITWPQMLLTDSAPPSSADARNEIIHQHQLHLIFLLSFLSSGFQTLI